MNVIKYFLALVIFALSVGCSTTPTPSSEAIPTPKERVLAFQDKSADKTSILVVTRDQGFVGGGCFYAVSIDSVLSARLDVSERVQFYLSSGEHLLKAGRDPQGGGLCGLGSDMWVQRETTLKAGETKYFRFSIDMNGTPDIHRAD
jgi:hypothetical protein